MFSGITEQNCRFDTFNRGCERLPREMDASTPSVAPAPADHEVMASLDTGAEERLVIADIARDDAWVSAPTTATAALADWR
ncbi:hypothetical protein GCM10009039_01920 [Halocalculus aciditolerans]|uniref:Uncharacterized protein n=2 Tax=Halocalculus aciditolerans TaxID=1383812 RepID=A0A830F1Y1_9EURY|nr:hypothetical protein GCM10009039_01920 [Halocalculus aciditolerans]